MGLLNSSPEVYAQALQLSGEHSFYSSLGRRLQPDVYAFRNRLRLNARHRFRSGQFFASIRVSHEAFDPENPSDADAPAIRLRESFVDIYTASVDFRIGQQYLVWGQADGAFITDFMSPLDLGEFLTQDFTDIRLGLPSIKASYFRGPLEISGVAVLYAPNSDLPNRGSRWFVVPTDLEGIPFEWNEEERPAFGRDRMEPAARIVFRGVRETDLAVSYAYSSSRIPAIRKGLQPKPGGNEPFRLSLEPVYLRRHAAGFRASSSFVDPWILSSEWLFESRFVVDQAAEVSNLASGLLWETPRLSGMVSVARSWPRIFVRSQLIFDRIMEDDQSVIRDPLVGAATLFVRMGFERERAFFNFFGYRSSEDDLWLNPSIQWSPGGGLNVYGGIHAFSGPSLSGISVTSAFGLFADNDLYYLRITQNF